MPHVVLNGEVTAEDVFSAALAIFIREEGLILKTGLKYIDEDKRNIIVEALAIEQGSKREFLIMVSQREDGVVVRLHPMLEIEKTAGVKRLLAETAKQIIDELPEVSVGATNLSEFL
jgi:hypothetical protein